MFFRSSRYFWLILWTLLAQHAYFQEINNGQTNTVLSDEFLAAEKEISTTNVESETRSSTGKVLSNIEIESKNSENGGGVSSEDPETRSEIESIFSEIRERPNVTTNTTSEKSEGENETKTDKSNSTAEAEIPNNVPLENSTTAANYTQESRAVEPGAEGDSGSNAIGTKESAAILAGVFVVIAAVGYLGFVLWRKVLQVRYGNSEMLITDDVYDITDLRYFEI